MKVIQQTYVTFWNTKYFTIINMIKDIVCNWNRNSLLMATNNILLVGVDIYEGKNYGIYLIDTLNH